MKYFIKPKHQYYILPLTYVFICAIAAVNYIVWGDLKKCIKTIIEGFIWSIVIGVCTLLINLLIGNSGFGVYFRLGFYLISSISLGVLFIIKQQKYIIKRNLINESNN